MIAPLGEIASLIEGVGNRGGVRPSTERETTPRDTPGRLHHGARV
jgi:hypothetical protein